MEVVWWREGGVEVVEGVLEREREWRLISKRINKQKNKWNRSSAYLIHSTSSTCALLLLLFS